MISKLYSPVHPCNLHAVYGRAGVTTQRITLTSIPNFPNYRCGKRLVNKGIPAIKEGVITGGISLYE